MFKNTQNSKVDNKAIDAQAFFNTFFKACKSVVEHNKSPDADWQEAYNIGQSFQSWFSELLQHPQELYQSQIQFYQEFFQLCKDIHFNLVQQTVPKPFIEDKRFKSAIWNEHPYFYYLHQSYLLFSKHLGKFINSHPGNSPELARKIEFFSKSFLDALSPTNFVFTNPEILKETYESQAVDDLILG